MQLIRNIKYKRNCGCVDIASVDMDGGALGGCHHHAEAMNTLATLCEITFVSQCVLELVRVNENFSWKRLDEHHLHAGREALGFRTGTCSPTLI